MRQFLRGLSTHADVWLGLYGRWKGFICINAISVYIPRLTIRHPLHNWQLNNNAPQLCRTEQFTIMWLLCAFSLVVYRDLLKDTHTDGVKSTSDHVSGLVFLFSCPKNPPINYLNFYCMKQMDYIFPCVCAVIDHRRRYSVQQSRHSSEGLNFISCRMFLFFTRCDVICDLLQHTHGKM